MKKILLICCLSLIVFSCKTKKTATTKRPTRTTQTTKQTSTRNKTEESTPKTVTNSPKVYASKTEEYIDLYKEVAQQEMQLYGIPASITLAQGILESASGYGRLSVEANNHFGIKCHGWTGAKIYHDDDALQECFRKYKDPKYSFRDHSLFLKDRKRYAALFDLKQEDYKGWAKGLRAAGYATDRKYPDKLISLIERYNLDEFDKKVLGKRYTPYQAPTYNQTYTVSKGDTLYSISRKYNLTVKELQKLNGLRSTNLSIGQVLIVKP